MGRQLGSNNNVSTTRVVLSWEDTSTLTGISVDGIDGGSGGSFECFLAFRLLFVIVVSVVAADGAAAFVASAATTSVVVVSIGTETSVETFKHFDSVSFSFVVAATGACVVIIDISVFWSTDSIQWVGKK
jgi:hypothetical protein